ncbi:hypothetical protein MASR2M39_28450 [Ignavibacteriales bacterium]
MSFTIGCDPELVLRENGKFVPASNYYKRSSSFGLDGCNQIAELRPGYSESPIDLTAKIKIILEYGHEKHPELEMFAGHFQNSYPIGGHLHLSCVPTSKLMDSLDAVLYSLSTVIDDKEQREAREKTGYGKRLEYRTKQYGFEYRTPGSWCISPSVTLVTLTLAKLAAIAVVEDDINLQEIKSQMRSDCFLRKLKTFLKTIPEDCVEGLNELEILIRKKLNWDQNILPNWGIAS